MENVSIKKYGIKDGNSSVVFSVDKVIELLVANADKILKNEGGKLVCPYADMYASAKLHEHGLVVEIYQDSDPHGFSKYDECGGATIFIFDDEIDYVVSQIKNPNEYYNSIPVNSDIIAELINKIGTSVEVDEDMLNNSRIRKISLALFSKKRELLNSKKELVQMKKTSYFSKLEHLLSEQKKVNK